MTHSSFRPFAILSMLALLGAGCGSAPSAPPAPLETEIPIATPPAPEPAPAATSTNESTSTTMTTEPLAFPGVLPDAQTANKIVRIQTTKGEIVFELLPKEGPKAASNFVYLTGKKFYDGLTFHRVESWVIQGGDPIGNGTGGPGYSFEDDKVNLSYNRGIVAMANAGPNTNGSQFFIMKNEVPLGPDYSIFGRVISGLDVVDQIAVGDKMTSVTVEDKK